jgi:hypothetical protein
MDSDLMNMERTQAAEGREPLPKAKWATIRQGNGKVTGYIEVFFCAISNGYVTIPGVSRFRDARPMNQTSPVSVR